MLQISEVNIGKCQTGVVESGAEFLFKRSDLGFSSAWYLLCIGHVIKKKTLLEYLLVQPR